MQTRGKRSGVPGKEQAQPPNPERKKRRQTLALYLVAFVFLVIVLWRSRIWDSGDTLSGISPGTLVVVPLLTLALIPPLALRQRAILRGLDHHINAVSLAPIAVYGNTVGFMTPAASGELLRPALFDRAFGVALHRGASVVLFERLYSMGLFCLTGLLALCLTGVLPAWISVPSVILLVLAMFAPLTLVRLLNIPIGRLPSLLPGFVQRRLVGLDEAGEAFERLWRAPGLAVEFVVLSLVTFSIMLVQFWLVFDGAGSEVGFFEVWVVVVAAAMAGMASGLPFGLGAGDAVMLSLLTAYDMDISAAAAAVVLLRLLINLPAGLMGLGGYIIALRQGIRQNDNMPFDGAVGHLATAGVRNDE